MYWLQFEIRKIKHFTQLHFRYVLSACIRVLLTWVSICMCFYQGYFFLQIIWFSKTSITFVKLRNILYSFHEHKQTTDIEEFRPTARKPFQQNNRHSLSYACMLQAVYCITFICAIESSQQYHSGITIQYHNIFPTSNFCHVDE